MAQHDYVIANQGFPAFRSDLNSALSAIVSNNSGADSPSTTYAYQMWYETDTNIWSMRNADNDAWIPLATFNQTNNTVNFTDSSSTVAGISTSASATVMTLANGSVAINPAGFVSVGGAATQGGEIRFLPGERSNIKITVSEDIPEERIGNGFDSHRFQEGDGLMIGGFKVPCGLSFAAHSDGDIVLHAIIDSMLGSLGLGDIGVHFPNTEEWKNASGKKLYKLTDEMIKEKGYSIKQLDIIVILEEPKLTPHRDEIINSLTKITGLSEANIGFKAKTSEKMGFIGKNEGAACLVVTKLNK